MDGRGQPCLVEVTDYWGDPSGPCVRHKKVEKKNKVLDGTSLFLGKVFL